MGWLEFKTSLRITWRREYPARRSSGRPAEGMGRPLMDVYVSLDVETDGPIPGRNSMLSLGAAKC